MSRNVYVGLLIVAVAGAVLFFYKTSSSPVIPPAPQEQQAEFGGVSLRLDYATTTAERERGLGGRMSIPDDYGMLFIFIKDDRYGFWMKDTLVPLDIFWLDAQGQVVSMALEVATSSYPDVFYPTVPARYVLETISGFARAHGIATGTPLRLKNFPSVSQ